FANRFVRTPKWQAEEAAGQGIFRAFGTAFPGDRLVRGIALESPVNVSVYPYAAPGGHTLLALGEQGLPWELDPATLETRGPFTFGGRLNALSPFAAHPKIDPRTGELWNFGISFSHREPRLNLYRFGPGGDLVYRRRYPLPFACSLHDFCLSPHHAIFYLSPYLLDMEALGREGGTLMGALSWQPERGARLLIVERESGLAVASVPVGERYSLHTINGFEEGDRLVVDVLELDRPVYDQYEEIPELFTSVHPGRPVRFEIDLRTGELAARREIGYALAPDFPAIDPRRFGRPYDDLWMLGISAAGRPGRKFFDQVLRASWSRPGEQDVWQAPQGSYLGGEPAFLGDPADERRGVVACQLFDARREASSFLVFDAHDVAAGPLAVLPLETPVHLGFHAIFEPAPAPS
ncbi:MAG TPA: carotenoid oxygenase family protein, partial [Thermoanaerobaculia bacterium]|nr:carotenoid oxygenase family protein [Thermoanaerobaculia bacterium]